jgi:hypothetical protein
VTPGATLVLDFATGELSLEDLSPTDYRRSNLVGAATALAQATGRRFDSPG